MSSELARRTFIKCVAASICADELNAVLELSKKAGLTNVRLDTPQTSEADTHEWVRNPVKSIGGIPKIKDIRLIEQQVTPDQILVLSGMTGMQVTLIHSENNKDVFTHLPVPTDDPNVRGQLVIVVGAGKNNNTVVFTDVVPESNWLGVYKPVEKPEKSWEIVLQDRIKAMLDTPNCDGTGCKMVNYKVINANTGQIIQSGTSINPQRYLHL